MELSIICKYYRSICWYENLKKGDIGKFTELHTSLWLYYIVSELYYVLWMFTNILTQAVFFTWKTYSYFKWQLCRDISTENEGWICTLYTSQNVISQLVIFSIIYRCVWNFKASFYKSYRKVVRSYIFEYRLNWLHSID